MASITRHVDLPGPISAAEDLWYDLRRRPGYVDGFGRVVKVEGPWPEAGARVLWDGPRGGRGRVAESVAAFEWREGQEVRLEDEKLRGTQTTTFSPNPDGSVHVAVRLAWTLKEGNPVVDWVWVRRAMGESLRRTLVRYRIERLADLDDERALQATAP